ncbi:MAG: bifunctional serine/threonine-protein kinase/formylglycine-generating enzyme family protein [Lysobacteraceae bacterium]
MNETPQPTSPPDAPVIPGYRIVRKLGQGGMATVWLAVQESLDRQVAIKVMLPMASMDEQQAQRFEHEARTIARLEHPHIVHIFEVGRTGDGRLYYVMAFLPRGDLSHRDLSSSQATVLNVLRTLLDALSYAHARGVVHRDVKAENVLFDGDDRPKLADFGIALSSRTATRLTSAGMTLGSGGYMAPEQSRGEHVDGRADLYSVGVLAYEMLAGELPFRATDPLALALKHAHNPVPRLPRHLAHWQPFIDRAMAKSRVRRYRNAATMRAALDRVEKRMNGAAASFGEYWHRFSSHPFWYRSTTRWLLGAAALASLLLLLVNLMKPPVPSPVEVAGNSSERSGASRPDTGETLATSVSQPADPAQLEAWLATLTNEPNDSAAAAGVSRQIEWLGEQAELDFAAGDDDGLKARKQQAEEWHDRFGTPLASAYTRFQRRVTGLLVSEQRQAQVDGDEATAKRAGQLLQSLGYAPEDEAEVAATSPERSAPGNRSDAAPRASSRSQEAHGSLSGLVSRRQYAAYVDATDRRDSRCRNPLSPMRIFDRRNWRAPGFEQQDNDPVVCVSVDDALAYLAWIGERDGRRYRLPAPTERPQNEAGFAEWTNACIASGDASAPCTRRVAAGPLLQERQLEVDRGYNDVSFRWVVEH